MTVSQLVRQLKDAGQDFEWYPTTDAMIQTVADDICRHRGYYTHDGAYMLDVGAGDGRVLQAIAERFQNEKRQGLNLLAVEKSAIHIQNMPKDISVIGTDFYEQTFVDKQSNFVFCNPPYSDYATWMTKLIQEVNCDVLYLVVPVRWKDNRSISDALECRNVKAKSLGEFDFHDADRAARARVEILAIGMDDAHSSFNAAIDDILPDPDLFNAAEELDDNEHVKNACELIKAGKSVVETLVSAYNAELAKLIENYQAVGRLHPSILAELGVTNQDVRTGIKVKLTGLKNKYWQVFFDRMEPLTKRLATKQRKSLLASLSAKNSIDFTEGNCLSVLIWATRWGNDFYDEQLTELFRRMSEKSNVQNYVSNQRTWKDCGWRYADSENCHYMLKLDYRIVLEHCGGICNSEYSWKSFNGLTETAFNFIQDCVTVANNLGFDCEQNAASHQWSAGKQVTIVMDDGSELMAVRAFKNGNLHVKFNQEFLLALNVEAGRLLGWIRSPEQLKTELALDDDAAAEAAKRFGSSFQITHTGLLIDHFNADEAGESANSHGDDSHSDDSHSDLSHGDILASDDSASDAGGESEQITSKSGNVLIISDDDAEGIELPTRHNVAPSELCGESDCVSDTVLVPDSDSQLDYCMTFGTQRQLF